MKIKNKAKKEKFLKEQKELVKKLKENLIRRKKIKKESVSYVGNVR